MGMVTTDDCCEESVRVINHSDRFPHFVGFGPVPTGVITNAVVRQPADAKHYVLGFGKVLVVFSPTLKR